MAKKLKKRPQGFIGWLRDVAGNATTETVIMMPVFIAIWGGIYYTHQRYRGAQNMAQFTRAHTWQHAFSNCEGGSPSPNTAIGESVSDANGFVGDVPSLIFDAGVIPGFQFDEIEGRRDTTVERPAVLGEGSVSMGHNIVMLCNEEPGGVSNFFDAARSVFF